MLPMRLFCALLSLVLTCQSANVNVSLDTKTPLQEVDDKFLSVTLDTYLMGNDVRWDTLDFRSRKLRALTRGLSPAYIRVGGTPADFLFFDRKFEQLNDTGLVPQVVAMTKTDWDNLVEFSRSTSTRLLFEFNLQTRYGDQWDPSNAIELLDYTVSKGYGENIDFELGNEPGFYDVINPKQARLTGAQIARDYRILKKLLDGYPGLRNSSIVGPDTMFGDVIFDEFVNVAGDMVEAATFHFYYFSGRTATYEEYINPFYMHYLTDTINIVKGLIGKSKYPDTKLWLGEGADARDHGTTNVSDRYVSGFLWLEMLGRAASMGVSVVMRQDLYGHAYGLINRDLDPNPDYWLSWLYKQLVGTKVIPVTLAPKLHDVSVYAHCSSSRYQLYDEGAVTFLVINFNKYEKIALNFNPSWNDKIKLVYLLQPHGPEGLLSQSVTLNLDPRPLQMSGSHQDVFPDISPLSVLPGDSVAFPPLTFGFVVIPHANFTLCK